MLMLSCGNDINSIVIDNPKEDDIKVKINDSVYKLYGYASKSIKLKTDTYYIRTLSASDSLLLEDQISITSDGILNPHLMTYVKWSDNYTSNISSSSLNKMDITINNNPYFDVSFEVYENQLFIPKTWDFNLFQQWESSVRYYFKKDVVMSKIYRLGDLEKEWGYTFDGDIESLNKKQLDSMVNSLNLKIKKFE